MITVRRMTVSYKKKVEDGMTRKQRRKKWEEHLKDGRHSTVMPPA